MQLDESASFNFPVQVVAHLVGLGGVWIFVYGTMQLDDNASFNFPVQVAAHLVGLGGVWIFLYGTMQLNESASFNFPVQVVSHLVGLGGVLHLILKLSSHRGGLGGVLNDSLGLSCRPRVPPESTGCHFAKCSSAAHPTTVRVFLFFNAWSTGEYSVGDVT